jgi:hypothetical protein
LNNETDIDGIQIAVESIQRERVQGRWVFAEGQALDPHPNPVFLTFNEVDVYTVSDNYAGGHGGWSKPNERSLAKIQSVAFDLVILYGLRPYKKPSVVQVK